VANCCWRTSPPYYCILLLLLYKINVCITIYYSGCSNSAVTILLCEYLSLPYKRTPHSLFVVHCTSADGVFLSSDCRSLFVKNTSGTSYPRTCIYSTEVVHIVLFRLFRCYISPPYKRTFHTYCWILLNPENVYFRNHGIIHSTSTTYVY
jgi:hypothetical protein